MKISIIIPVYNVEDYLCECIDSVLAQAYSLIEVLLIDDGSTDNSGKICDLYTQKNPGRITVIHTENTGPMHARIRGIQEASGDILIFLDSDDCLRRDACSILADIFTQYCCDMIFFNAEQCDLFPSMDVNYPFLNKQVFEGDTKNRIYQNIAAGKITNSLCLKAVKRNCATLPESYLHLGKLKHGEDLLISACLITNCKKIVYINEGLYHYRKRLGSTTHSFDVGRKESIKVVHRELENYIELWDMPQLKPVHNARKVRGWMDSLILLIKNKNHIGFKEFREQLSSMANDPYFRTAYKSMDKSYLSHKHRLLAWLLYYGHVRLTFA